MNDVLYPGVIVELSGTDGNAFTIIAKVTAALRKAKAPQSAIRQFQTQAMSGDYDNLLRVCMSWVEVE